MQEISDKYSDKGVKVLGILKDNKISDARKLLDERGGKYTNIITTDILARKFLDEMVMRGSIIVIVNSFGELLGEPILGAHSADEFSDIIDKALDEAEKQAEIRSKIIAGGDLSIGGFAKALKANSFEVIEVGKISSGILGVAEGYKYTVNSRNIEIYQLDFNSKDSLIVENIKSIKESGMVRIPLREGDHVMPLIIKGNIAVNGIEKHKYKERILKIFNSLE